LAGVGEKTHHAEGGEGRHSAGVVVSGETGGRGVELGGDV